MKRSLTERNEIVTVVRSRTSVVAWVTEKGVIIYNPAETKLTVLVGADRSFLRIPGQGDRDSAVIPIRIPKLI